MKEVIARRMSLIDSSGIRKVFELGAKLENPVNLSIGQPDFDAFDSLKESAIKAIKEGKNRYTLTQGIPELCSAILNKYRKMYPKYPPEKVIITSGVSGGLFLALLVLVNKGDEVLIPDPYFVMYKHLTNLIGGRVKFYDTYPDFKLHPERIKDLITDRTKVIIINSPNNPTGAVYSADEIKEVVEIAEKKGIIIISDEIYDIFIYKGKYTSIMEFTNQAVVIKGFSKCFGIPGWRIGFALGPEKIINEMIKLQQFSFVCAPSPFQWAVYENIDYDTSKITEEYKKKRDLIYTLLKEKFNVVKPEGAFYIFPESPVKPSTEFVKKAIENKLLIIPGNVFSEKDTHFRISFAASSDTLRKGAEILNSLF